jgi:hypothetical protein
MPLATSGVGQKVRDAPTARAEHLAREGLVRRQGPSIVPLRRRELDAVGALSNEIRMPYSPPAASELVAGTFRRCFTLSSGRFAMIDNAWALPSCYWTPALDRYVGRHVAGVARESGGIEWSFGRKRGLEI